MQRYNVALFPFTFMGGLVEGLDVLVGYFNIRELFALLNKVVLYRLFAFIDLQELTFLCRKVGINRRF